MNILCIKVGNTVGIKKCDGELQFWINGSRMARVKLNSAMDIYGAVGVRGAATMTITGK